MTVVCDSGELEKIRSVADNDLRGVIEDVERLVWVEHKISRYIPRCIKISASYDKKLLGGKLSSMTPG